MKLISFGAAETVTGSKHLLLVKNRKILIDCGLFQGEVAKNTVEVEELLKDIDAIVLTHGHLDHTGYIPKLVKHGFHGPIFATAATAQVAKLIMEDNAKIQAQDVRRINKSITKKSKKISPLYDLNDVSQTIPLFRICDWGKKVFWNDLEIDFYKAGHILGASIVRIFDGENSIIFSGDLGRPNDPIMPDPATELTADAVVMECTYGDRLHDLSNTPESDLILALKECLKRRGTLLIPAFSVARSQNILYYLNKIFHNKPELEIPVYVDSPLTKAVTELYERFDSCHKISKKEFKAIYKNTHFIEFTSQREKLDINEEVKVIVTASGMMTGGRIPHYLDVLSENQNNILMVVGFQADGTLGRLIAEGARTFDVQSKSVTWKGDVIISKSFSSHADQDELLNWLNNIKGFKKVYLVHGEIESLDSMKNKIGEKAIVVQEKQSYKLF